MQNDNEHARTDPWLEALGPVSAAERRGRRRPRPGPGRHRPDVPNADAWQRALTGPPISDTRHASRPGDYVTVG